MNKEFADRIYLIPADELPNPVEAPYNDFDQLHSDVNINPTCVQNEAAGNIHYNFNVRCAFSDIADAIIDKYRNRRPLVAILFDTDGNAYQIGNANQKLRAEISTVKFVHDLQLSGQLLISPF